MQKIANEFKEIQMSVDKFRAIVVSEVEDKKFEREIKERLLEDLPPGDVLVRVK